MKGTLTARQLAFVDAFTGGSTRGNATASYVVAGYSRKGAEAGAARLLANVKVAEVVQERQHKAAATAEITLQGYVEMCRRVATWWEQNGAKPDASTVKAVELLGRVLGFLRPNDNAPPEPIIPVPVYLPAKRRD